MNTSQILFSGAGWLSNPPRVAAETQFESRVVHMATVEALRIGGDRRGWHCGPYCVVNAESVAHIAPNLRPGLATSSGELQASGFWSLPGDRRRDYRATLALGGL
jgi:hypothetical protein